MQGITKFKERLISKPRTVAGSFLTKHTFLLFPIYASSYADSLKTYFIFQKLKMPFIDQKTAFNFKRCPSLSKVEKLDEQNDHFSVCSLNSTSSPYIVHLLSAVFYKQINTYISPFFVHNHFSSMMDFGVSPSHPNAHPIPFHLSSTPLPIPSPSAHLPTLPSSPTFTIVLVTWTMRHWM